jgi:hypothetical protein
VWVCGRHQVMSHLVIFSWIVAQTVSEEVRVAEEHQDGGRPTALSVCSCLTATKRNPTRKMPQQLRTDSAVDASQATCCKPHRWSRCTTKACHPNQP